MPAFNDFRLVIIAAYFLFDGRNITTAFSEEYNVGTFEMAHWLAQNSARQHPSIAEWICGIYENNLN